MITDVLKSAEKAGVELFVKDKELQYRCRSGRLSNSLREAIRLYRSEILDHLRPRRTDPRPDLVDDSTLWTAVLELAGPDLSSFLHGCRCGGARLNRIGDSLKLDYRPLLEIGWDREELVGSWLLPRRDDLERLFDRVAHIVPIVCEVVKNVPA